MLLYWLYNMSFNTLPKAPVYLPYCNKLFTPC